VAITGRSQPAPNIARTGRPPAFVTIDQGAAVAHVFGKMMRHLTAGKALDLSTDNVKAMLLSAYTPDTTAHEYVSDVLAVGAEAIGTGYTAGGLTLPTPTLTTVGLVHTLTCGALQWDATGGSLAARFVLFYDATPGTNATNPVLCYWDLGSTKTALDALFRLNPDATGLISWTAA
jgi:hypothetical protein